MWDFLTHGKWDMPGVLSFFMLAAFFVTAIVASIAIPWSLVRQKEIRANSIRDMLDRGMSIEQVERLVGTPSEDGNPAKAKQLDAQFASLLVQNEVPAPTMERVLRIYQQTDPVTKKAVYDSLEEIIGSSPTEEQLVAAVKALCPAPAGPAPSARFEEIPATT
jgi:hypothetical protein